jgi:hypothetical protein
MKAQIFADLLQSRHQLRTAKQRDKRTFDALRGPAINSFAAVRWASLMYRTTVVATFR